MQIGFMQYHRAESGGPPTLHVQQDVQDDLVLLAGTLYGKLNIGLNVGIVL